MTRTPDFRTRFDQLATDARAECAPLVGDFHAAMVAADAAIAALRALGVAVQVGFVPSTAPLASVRLELTLTASLGKS